MAAQQQAAPSAPTAQPDNAEQHALNQRVANLSQDARRRLDSEALAALADHESRVGPITQKSRRLTWIHNQRCVILAQRDADFAAQQERKQKGRGGFGVNPNTQDAKAFGRSLRLSAKRAAAGL